MTLGRSIIKWASILCIFVAAFYFPLVGIVGLILGGLLFKKNKKLGTILAIINIIALIIGMLLSFYVIDQSTNSWNRVFLDNDFINGNFEGEDFSAWAVYRDIYINTANEQGKFVPLDEYLYLEEDDTDYMILSNDESNTKISVAQSISLKGLSLEQCNVVYRYGVAGELGASNPPNFIYSKIIFMDDENGVLGVLNRFFGVPGTEDQYHSLTSLGSRADFIFEDVDSGWVYVDMNLAEVAKRVNVIGASKLRLSFGALNGNGDLMGVAVDDVQLICT
jgi:hypothetical protein